MRNLKLNYKKIDGNKKLKTEILTILGILLLAISISIIGIHKLGKIEEEKYYNEIFYEPSSNYIVLNHDEKELIELPAYSSFIKDKRNAFKAIDIGLYYHNEVEHPSDGWTLTSEPEGIVKYKISDDGKKLLLAGQKPGITEILISHSEADFGKVLKVMVPNDITTEAVEEE